VAVPAHGIHGTSLAPVLYKVTDVAFAMPCLITECCVVVVVVAAAVGGGRPPVHPHLMDTRVVYLFGDPLASICSHYRRGHAHQQVKNLAQEHMCS
jgi:hypothetical protein